MANFLLSYHGGSMPETPEEGERVMAQWTAWFAQLGAALVDGGNPTGATKTIASNGSVTDGAGQDSVTGYSVITAGSLDAAVALAKGCPILSNGSVVVGELIPTM